MKLILEKLPMVKMVYEAENGKQCVEYFQKGGFAGLVFMDIEMPEMNGIEACRTLLQSHPETRVIALSMYADEDYYTHMIEAGAKGFILKNSGIEDVENAILQVSSGNNYFSQEILAGLIRSLNRKIDVRTSHSLSEREAEVLGYICKGMSNQEIADDLHLSKRTVDKHRENLLSKTGCKNTAGLVIYAIKNGIMEI